MHNNNRCEPASSVLTCLELCHLPQLNIQLHPRALAGCCPAGVWQQRRATASAGKRHNSRHQRPRCSSSHNNSSSPQHVWAPRALQGRADLQLAGKGVQQGGARGSTGACFWLWIRRLSLCIISQPPCLTTKTLHNTTHAGPAAAEQQAAAQAQQLAASCGSLWLTNTHRHRPPAGKS